MVIGLDAGHGGSALFRVFLIPQWLNGAGVERRDRAVNVREEGWSGFVQYPIFGCSCQGSIGKENARHLLSKGVCHPRLLLPTGLALAQDAYAKHESVTSLSNSQ